METKFKELKRLAELCGLKHSMMGEKISGQVIVVKENRSVIWNPFEKIEQAWECLNSATKTYGQDFVEPVRGIFNKLHTYEPKQAAKVICEKILEIIKE